MSPQEHTGVPRPIDEVDARVRRAADSLFHPRALHTHPGLCADPRPAKTPAAREPAEYLSSRWRVTSGAGRLRGGASPKPSAPSNPRATKGKRAAGAAIVFR